jgi:hypothetical protein
LSDTNHTVSRSRRRRGASEPTICRRTQPCLPSSMTWKVGTKSSRKEKLMPNESWRATCFHCSSLTRAMEGPLPRMNSVSEERRRAASGRPITDHSPPRWRHAARTRCGHVR